MDQKNTIVKCKAHPDCLFNYNGVCDNYVINIGTDGKCEEYVETASEEDMKNGVIGKYKELTLKERKVCHPDCIHFYDSDPMVGPICLFKHPEPLKDFYEGMPCNYYHSTNYARGQRAKCNVYDDACDISFLKEDLEKIQQTLEQKSIPCIMKVAEFNKPNKNQSAISDWDYAATPDICKTCKKVVYGQPCKWKDVAYGVWTCYEIDESIKKAGALNECWWCDFFNAEKRRCKQKHPDIDKYGCHSVQSTGGNR